MNAPLDAQFTVAGVTVKMSAGAKTADNPTGFIVKDFILGSHSPAMLNVSESDVVWIVLVVDPLNFG